MNNETEPQPINLNLPKSRVDDSFYDIYKKIKEKKNREMIPMTIRIDEMVYAGIKNSAKKEGVSINVLVNDILTSYVTAISGGLYTNLIIQETAICDFLDRLQKSYLDDDKISSEMNKIKKRVKLGMALHPDLELSFDFFDILIHISDQREAKYVINDIEDVGKYGYLYEIYVPEKKFYIIAPILIECSRKKESLGWQEEPSENTLEKMCRLINSSKQTKSLVKKLTEALKPNLDRTSIWYKNPKERRDNES